MLHPRTQVIPSVRCPVDLGSRTSVPKDAHDSACRNMRITQRIAVSPNLRLRLTNRTRTATEGMLAKTLLYHHHHNRVRTLPTPEKPA